jgi:hypothetical protein
MTPKKTELPINYRNFFDDLKKKKTPSPPLSPGTPQNLFLKKSEIFEDDNLSLPTIRRKFLTFLTNKKKMTVPKRLKFW